ncbi:hypothetical protein PV08_06724 [Exophiala spinifera]|uniref:Uncharacterized protein n=1 Tax=Exophiala spinifera TaxID=91928 RepID=A0A0D2B4V8_9EURO|nr:uncharacterized protein PV08_06724 [Exophiala spinifera]KIW13943.1 hypothetical protein PV08_06724 [Exophiala spinifera]
MAKKSGNKPIRRPALPKAPIIYINDPVAGMPHARYIRDLIPNCILAFGPPDDKDALAKSTPYSLEKIQKQLKLDKFNDRVLVVGDNRVDEDTEVKIETAKEFHKHAIKYGCNFASINLYFDGLASEAKLKSWNSNHLNLCISNIPVKDIAEKIFRWLFTALTVHETLHLIPDSEMTKIDTKSFPDYKYCPISDSKYHGKDAKIQFVALVTSRPEVVGDRLQWSVADKTGSAHFYFQYRGPSSQYTWDWVQKLQVGDRKVLPRMPMVKIKERKTVRVAKAPFRAAGYAVQGVGVAVSGVARGLEKIGEMSKMGKSAEWVPEADVLDGKKVGWQAKQKELAKRVKMEKAAKKVDYKVFNEKGEKTWKDDDSVASTAKGSDAELVLEKEFC